MSLLSKLIQLCKKGRKIKEPLVSTKILDENLLDTPFFTKDKFQNKYGIGQFTYGFPEVFQWGEESSLMIGNFCSIADNVKIFLGGNHRIDWITTYPFNSIDYFFPESKYIQGHPATKGNVVIGNDVWIGYGAIILSGVKISDGAVIAAGAVVSKNVGPYEIWVGNPARFIKKRFSDNTIEMLLTEQWWNWPLEKIKENLNYLNNPPV